eukprot:7830867-Pyramimonas_sp.AAC.1
MDRTVGTFRGTSPVEGSISFASAGFNPSSSTTIVRVWLAESGVVGGADSSDRERSAHRVGYHPHAVVQHVIGVVPCAPIGKRVSAGIFSRRTNQTQEAGQRSSSAAASASQGSRFEV